jgi:hypothetical protein
MNSNEPTQDYLTPNASNAMQLPNATASLVLGILSIVVCFICGIIALVLANKDIRLYKNNPGLYSEASYSNVKAGRTCAIIGIALQGVGLLIYILVIAFVISSASTGAFR